MPPGLQDELLWAAAWLHKATKSRRYIQYIFQNGMQLGADETMFEFGWDNKHAGVNVFLAKVNTILSIHRFFHQNISCL